MPRLLIVAEGDTACHARLRLDDQEITTMVRRITIDLDAAGVTFAQLTLIPRDGLAIDVFARTAVAFLPVAGFQWTETEQADGSWRVRCERVRAETAP